MSCSLALSFLPSLSLSLQSIVSNTHICLWYAELLLEFELMEVSREKREKFALLTTERRDFNLPGTGIVRPGREGNRERGGGY